VLGMQMTNGDERREEQRGKVRMAQVGTQSLSARISIRCGLDVQGRPRTLIVLVVLSHIPGSGARASGFIDLHQFPAFNLSMVAHRHAEHLH
jgi:hypothetical protein